VFTVPPASSPLPSPAPLVRAAGGNDADAALNPLMDGQVDDGDPALFEYSVGCYNPITTSDLQGVAMALVRCPECGKEVSSDAQHCIHCGKPLKKKKGSSIGNACILIIAVPIIIVVIGLIVILLVPLLDSSPRRQSSPAPTAQNTPWTTLNQKPPQEGATNQAPPDPGQSTAVPQAAQPPAADARFEDCRAKLKKAQQLELLYNLDYKGGVPLVVVGPTFYTVPFDTKQNFADTINCFLMTGEAKYINFDLRDYRTNEVVAVYRFGKLKMK